MKRFQFLGVITFFSVLCAGCLVSDEKETTSSAAASKPDYEPAEQAKLRETFHRELRLCEAVGEQRPACLQAIAVENKEPFFCSEITDNSGGLRTACYRRLGAITGKSSLCEKVDPPDFQSQCFIEAAAVNRDVKSCPPATWKGDPGPGACAAVAERRAEGCNEIDKQKEFAVYRSCFQSLAVVTRDTSLCARLKTEGTDLFVHECIREVAIKRSSIATCEEIPTVSSLASQISGECHAAVGLFLKSGVRCEERDPLCDGKTAAASNDLELCRRQRSYTNIDNCLVTYAYKTGDSTVCSEMQKTEGRAICHEVARRGKSATNASGAPLSTTSGS